MKRWPSVGAIVLVLLTACASQGGAGPTAQERELSVTFLRNQPLEEFALAVFNLNGFLYVD